MRHLGAKLAKDQLGPPIAGMLTIERWKCGSAASWHWVTSAGLATGYGSHYPQIIPSLTNVVIRKAGPEGMLLLGVEHILQRGEFRQAWWCRLAP